MSLLSDTQGRPERVWSLLRLLAALDGRATTGDIETWMMPPPFRTAERSLVQVHQTVGCARSLGFVRDEDDTLVLDVVVPASLEAFGDLVHERLCHPPNEADRVVLRAYACCLAITEKAGGSTEWLTENADRIAGHLDDALQRIDPSPQRLFNATKAPAWRAWLVALGLAVEGAALPSLYPQPTARMARLLPTIAQTNGWDVEIPARTFVDELAARMPYLEGGSLFTEAASSCGFKPRPGWLGGIASEALRDLHDEGAIELRSRADARDALSLHAEAGARQRSVVGVVIPREGAR